MKILNSNLKKFQSEALKSHNLFRSKHGVAPLIWSDELAHNAKNWAYKLSKLRIIKHQDLPDEGENIAFYSGKNPDGDIITRSWYNEIQNYDFNNPESKVDVFHFTQIIWAGSKNFGIYYIENKNDYYIVARYSPPGNIRGQFYEMVPRPFQSISQIVNSSNITEETIQKNEGINIKIDKDDNQTNLKENISKDLVYLNQYNEKLLKYHNQVRLLHQVYPLELDENLINMAQDFAQKLLNYRIKKGDLPIFPPSTYGKSITFVVGRDLPHPRSISNSWYEGNNYYDFNTAQFDYKNGGFTQMIWKNTKKVGFGIYWSDNHSIIVGLYFPAGNVKGSYKENVLPLKYINQETNI